MKFNEKIGLTSFYTILLLSLLITSFGLVIFDPIIIGIGVSLSVCALLIKLEFNLEVFLEKTLISVSYRYIFRYLTNLKYKF